MDYSTPPGYSQQLPPAAGQPVPGTPQKGGKRRRKGGKDGQAPTKRVVDRQKVIAALFALIVAGGLAGQQYLSKAPNLYVVRVSSDVPAMTQVTPGMLTSTAVTANLLEPGAISAPSAAQALAAAAKITAHGHTQYPLHAGQQLHSDEFSTDGQLLAAPLAPDERLLSISGNVASSVAGTIRPGDHVDVLAVASSGSGMSGVIASDVPVVSVTVSQDQYNNASSQQSGADRTKKASELLPADPIPGIYVLRVKASQMTALTVADATAKVYLAYRGQGATVTDNTPQTVQQAICTGAVGVAGC